MPKENKCYEHVHFYFSNTFECMSQQKTFHQWKVTLLLVHLTKQSNHTAVSQKNSQSCKKHPNGRKLGGTRQKKRLGHNTKDE